MKYLLLVLIALSTSTFAKEYDLSGKASKDIHNYMEFISYNSRIICENTLKVDVEWCHKSNLEKLDADTIEWKQSIIDGRILRVNLRKVRKFYIDKSMDVSDFMRTTGRVINNLDNRYSLDTKQKMEKAVIKLKKIKHNYYKVANILRHSNLDYI